MVVHIRLVPLLVCYRCNYNEFPVRRGEHRPELTLVTESKEVPIIWDKQLFAATDLSASKSDIAIKVRANRCSKVRCVGTIRQI